MRLMILENTLGFDRFIVIPARKYGNSVQRKTTGRDIALVVYPGKVSSYSLLESDFHSLLDRVERR